MTPEPLDPETPGEAGNRGQDPERLARAERWRRALAKTGEMEVFRGKLSGIIPPASEEEARELESIRRLGETDRRRDADRDLTPDELDQLRRLTEAQQRAKAWFRRHRKVEQSLPEGASPEEFGRRMKEEEEREKQPGGGDDAPAPPV